MDMEKISSPYKPYYFQTKDWNEFWVDAVNSNYENKHKIHFIKTEGEDVDIFAYICEYPWQMGQKFLYLAKGPIFSYKNLAEKSDLFKIFKRFLLDIESLALEVGAIFVKIDFYDAFLKELEFSSIDKVNDFIKTNIEFKTKKVDKNVHYKMTMFLDCDGLKKPKFKKNSDGVILKNDYLTELYEENAEFWGRANQNVRRYTKKSLKKDWKASIEKTEENFEAFWKVYKKTSSRQNFAIHKKGYLKDFFDQPFSRIIILRDVNDKPQGAWLGLFIDWQLVYIYGGNTPESFKNYGQYLMHLVATHFLVEEGGLIYDLGGYDSSEGFGKFKDMYRGEVRGQEEFIDILIKPFKYKFTNLLIGLYKAIRRIF